MTRIPWGRLPSVARAAVEECTGPVLAASTAPAGMNSGVAARLQTASGPVFVKGILADHQQMVSQDREAAINPYLPASSPRLLWRVQAGGWDLLGFELIEGRAADYAPGSPDLPLVAAALDELAATPCPDIPLLDLPARYASHTDRPELFAGQALLHTDINPENTLVSDATGSAHLVDWAWPSKGAAWVDPAVWVIRLIAAGHSPQEAEAWAAKTQAWGAAPADAVTLFARASVHMWVEIADLAGPDPEWQRAVADAAVAWSVHRLLDSG